MGGGGGVIDRRQFGAGASAFGLAGCRPTTDPLPGTLGGADFARGHLLRQALASGRADTVIRTGIVIVGGGVAGLSAALTLAEAGRQDFRLLELEDVAGGNARNGRNAVSAFPLGAHYLPVPNPESRGIHRLLATLGILTGWRDSKPLFDPYSIVADPEQRLLFRGRWQEGLVPGIGLTPRDRHDLAAFFAAMARWRQATGTDGRPAFAIPMALGSRDPTILALDRITIADWVRQQGWTSPVLGQHLRYVYRDEFGTEPGEVSAWAGIHYFAARRGVAANCDGDAVLTWPGGNGELTRRMALRVQGRIMPGHVVGRVEPAGAGVRVSALDVAARRRIDLLADTAILAVPRFVAARLVDGWATSATGFSYAPWVVANVTVDRLPQGPGAALAWDNVSATSNSLGYVVATHQSLAAVPTASVLTWYLPLSDGPPAERRRWMLARTLADWQQLVMADLLAMNPDLAGAIRRIDVWRWGHAMPRPTPGFIWGAARQAAAQLHPPILAAHSDLSGLPVFEEAHDRGVAAALVALGRDPEAARA